VFAIDADHYANVSVNITERKQVEDALRESDEKYRAFIEQTSEAITFVDEQGNITEWNHARETLTGWKLEAVIGKPYWEIRLKLLPPEMRTPEYAQRLKSTTLEMLQTGQSKFFNRVSEGELFTATGERRIVEQISFPIKTRKGYRVTSIMRDITERKRAEDELRRSEEKYRGLLESMDNVIATVNDEGKFLYMNDKAAEQLGGNVQELTGKTMLELFPEPFASRQLANIQKVISEDKAIISENQSFFKGIPRWQHTTIQPIHDEHGRVIYALVNATDIHDIKETQEKLLELNRTLEDRVRERTAQVRDLYDNAPAGYHSLDKDGTIVMINQTELMWLGYTHEEIIGVKKFRDLLTPQSQQSFDEKFPRFIEQGRAKDIEFEIVRKNGDILPIILSATALYDSNGKFLQSRTTMFDITERRQAEVALRESRDALSIANLALEKAARMKDEFLASMSHELRTPLTGILGLSEALQLNTYGELTAKQQRTIKAIEDSGRHLLELINDILDLSKIEAGKVELDILPCSLADICQSSLQLTKGMAQKKQIHVEYVPLGEPVMIRADARRVKQILVNLLSNAVKFTQENGQMGLEVQKDEAGQKIRLIVWDKGIGIKPEDQHKLFKPFTQIDSSLAREYAGTGLGLSLVRRLTELHHGSVEVESVFGEGSRFIVTLPWSPQASSIIPKSAQANIGRQSNPALTPGTSQSLVLIVDDNETVLQMIADFLTVNHYHVMTAQSGTEMLEMAAEHHPNLIMVDIQMPGMDGLDAIRRLRTHPDPVAAAVPVLAVTALAMAGDRERCLAAGANDYMSKPVKLVHLIETIKKLIYAF
jgi:PAS domain S-box-containing protein